MDNLAEAFGLFIFSSVKLLFAPGTAVAAGYTFLETFLITFAGASFGVFLFYYLGKWLSVKIGGYFPTKNRIKKRFTKKNKLIIRTKNRFGAMGVAALMGLISVPIAAIIAARYFRNSPNTVTYLLLSALVWTLSLTFISIYVRQSVF